MSRRLLLIVLSALTLLVVVVLVERALISDEERVEMSYDLLRAAVEEESVQGLELLLTPDFSFSGPSPIQHGSRATAFARFAQFWAVAGDVGVLPRGTSEVTVVGGIATLRVPQLVRFKMGDHFVAYRVDAVLTFDRIGDAFQLAQIEVTQLRPGLL